MKKILAAIDFSVHTPYICDFAIRCALLHKAEIMLFHTCYDKFYISSQGLHDTFDINSVNNLEDQSYANEQLKKLQAEMQKSLSGSNIKVFTKLSTANFEDDLKAFCSEYHPSVILVGSRGKDESSSLFGSTTINVFNKLKYPVIAIPAIENAEPLRNIMYIMDLEASNDLLIRRTFNLLEENNPKIFCVNLAEDGDYLNAYKLKDELMLTYKKEAEYLNFQCDVLEAPDKHEEIDRYILENKIDMIVFMPHKTNFFQRLFGKENKDYLFETNLPILAVRM